MASATGQPATIHTKIGTDERIGSAIAGTALILQAFVRPTLGRIALAVGGAILLARTVTGRWTIYEALAPTAPAEPIATRGRVLVGHEVTTVREHEVTTVRETDPVTIASRDSFPASDPPSWTPVEGTLPRRR